MSTICEGIVMEAGPISHWWDENWETPEHWRYVKWRDMLSAGLVEANFLVYHPHNAFKGVWDDRAQSVNDAALKLSDVILNMTPPGVHSKGTVGELLYAKNYDSIVLPAPPTEDFEEGVADVVRRLQALDIRREAVVQRDVEAVLSLSGSQERKLTDFLDQYNETIMRLHYFDHHNRIQAVDVERFSLNAIVRTVANSILELDPRKMIKIEALGGLAINTT